MDQKSLFHLERTPTEWTPREQYNTPYITAYFKSLYHKVQTNFISIIYDTKRAPIERLEC